MKLYWQNISWYWAVPISHISMSWCFQWRITERDIYRHAIIKQYHSFHTIFKLHYWGGWGLGVGRDCSWGETLGLGGIWSDLYKIEAYALSKILNWHQTNHEYGNQVLNTVYMHSVCIRLFCFHSFISLFQ